MVSKKIIRSVSRVNDTGKMQLVSMAFGRVKLLIFHMKQHAVKPTSELPVLLAQCITTSSYAEIRLMLVCWQRGRVV